MKPNGLAFALIALGLAISTRPMPGQYFGNASGLTGVNQVNVRVPAGVAPGPAVPVRLTYVARTSNEVTIGLQ